MASWMVLRQVIGAALGCAVITPATLAQTEYSLSGFAGVERQDLLAGDDFNPGLASGLEEALVADARLRVINRVDDNRFMFEFYTRADSFFESNERSTVRFRPAVQYQRYNLLGGSSQLRLRAEAEHRRRDGDGLHDLIRGLAEWRTQIAERQAVFAGVRYTDYDYEDSITNGLDSDRVRYEIGHEWRESLHTRVRSRVMFEQVDADLSRFTYDEIGVVVYGTTELNDTWSTFFTARYRQRDFEGAFSAADPQVRDDELMGVHVGARRTLSETIKAVGWVGWEQNSSNIATRDYNGLVFRLGLEYDFDW